MALDVSPISFLAIEECCTSGSDALALNAASTHCRDSGKDQLERIKEATVLWHPESMHGHPVKSAICLMIAELLDHLFIEKTDQTALWNFLDRR